MSDHPQIFSLRKISLWITSLILLAWSAAADTPPTGCYGTAGVNVCFSPWKVILAEPGYNGVVMRKGPSFDADPVCNNTNSQPVVIPVNHHFARSSNRDGGVTNDCPNPGPRVNVNGFLWSYFPEYAKQGWVPYNVGGVSYAVGDNSYAGTLCGPAGFDFDSRYPKSSCVQYHGCGGSPVPLSSCTTNYRRVIAVGSTPGDLSQEKYYLRYACDSTTFFWLVPGDVVQAYCTASVDGFNWNCVSVQCAKYAPYGCRGWIRSDALGDPIDASSFRPCYPAIPCPDGNQSTPAAVLSFDSNLTGQFEITVTGVPGFNYSLQRSADLQNWVSLQTNKASFTFTESATDAFQGRFYRATYVP